MRRLAQGTLEFAMALPIFLTLVFVVIELARVFYAWATIENNARAAARYLSTGQYDEALCLSGCVDEADREQARLRAGQMRGREIVFGLLITSFGEQAGGPGSEAPGFYGVTICSSRAGFEFDPATLRCRPSNDAGGPGDRVVVVVRHNHMIITPLLRPIVSQIPLIARREAINERFRTVRLLGLPPQIPTVVPPPTPTPTPTVTPT
ncbi:MAG: pilus assembly protein, partial [Thermoflexus sp.]|nr:pilus assembly protein [Thermoflexus sp.]